MRAEPGKNPVRQCNRAHLEPLQSVILSTELRPSRPYNLPPVHHILLEYSAMLQAKTTFRNLIVAMLYAFAAGLSGMAGAAQAQAQADIVGEVLTAIGSGRIISGVGQTQAAARGVGVRAGDRVETAVGGHVHIRFVDGALVSVRPLSRLHIEDYRNGDAQSSAAIKFRLEEGVMRSVTGAWGEARRDHFRLNTPIAAIGIKGTDFVVRADAASTLASVATGAIVMAPLEGACAQALGPCSGENAVQLSADMRGMMLEMRAPSGVTAPQLVPAVDLLARAGGGMVVYSGKNVVGQVGGEITQKIPVGDTSATLQTDSALTDVDLRPASKPLVWLHNAAGWNIPANSISQRYDAALAVGRTPVVGNFFITLYRDETVVPTYAPYGTAVAFNLASGSASYVPSKGAGLGQNVDISGATLNVDFARATFATRMDLASPAFGQTEFAASGSVGANGLFANQQSGQTIAGALSTDGREAGYQFAKTLPGGVVSGITLWGH